MIAVTFALPAESAGFLRRLHNKSHTNKNDVRIIQGQLDDCKIKVLHTGVGETICRQRMATFLQEQQFNYLISAGFAGALNDGLHVGDLLLAENVAIRCLDSLTASGYTSRSQKPVTATPSSPAGVNEQRRPCDASLG